MAWSTTLLADLFKAANENTGNEPSVSCFHRAFDELSSYVIRIESKLAEIEAQEPVRWSWKLTNGYLVNMYESKEDAISDMTGFGEGDPVALYSLPVQPSPAVAVHDGEDILRTAQDEIDIFERPSVDTSRKLMEEVERLRAMLSTPTPPSAEQVTRLPAKIGNQNFPIGTPVNHILNAAYFHFGRNDDNTLVEQPNSAAVEHKPIYQVCDEFGTAWIDTTKGHYEMRERAGKDHRIVYLNPPTKPQRITEQDAREIFDCLVVYYGIKTGPIDFECWVSGIGHALLDKLNENREPDYKAHEWQPIETVPKNGSVILLSNEYGVWIGHYKPVYPSGFCPDNPWFSLMLNHEYMQKPLSLIPKAWMSLESIAKASASTDSGVE